MKSAASERLGRGEAAQICKSARVRLRGLLFLGQLFCSSGLLFFLTRAGGFVLLLLGLFLN